MFDTLPPGLDTMPPGPELAAALAGIEPSRVSGHDRVVVLRAEARMQAHYAARKYRSMAAIHDAVADDLAGAPHRDSEVEEAAAAEIKAALCLTGAAAGNELGVALLLRDRVPAVLRSLAAGRIDQVRARVLVEETANVAAEVARRIVAEVIDWAAAQTTSQIKRRVRRLVIAFDPAAARERYERAVAERRVVAEPNPDGTANLLGLDLPPHRVAAVKRYLTHCARKLRRQGDRRTMDQLRADLMLDLLSGKGAPVAGKGTVDLRVDVATLVGLSDAPGDLGGYGPIVADLARQLALESTDVEWRYVVTDPDTGRMHQLGTTRRRPTAALRRFVAARDPTCVFPGCVAPSGDSDLDHMQPWSQGGPTTIENLAPPCPTHHQLRHRIGWSYAATERGYTWTTRLGHHYTVTSEADP